MGGPDDAGHVAVEMEAKSPEPFLLESIGEQEQIALEFRKVSTWVSSALKPPSLLDRVTAKLGRSSKKIAESKRQILHSISGDVRPGEVLALMGPSGSGKTSLLSVLSGRTAKVITTSGDVLANGQAMTKAVKRKTGFVLQDDLLYESLTVFETLLYASLLRLPRETPYAGKVKRVDAVIKVLGLERCRDTIIGGFFRRGISGGERKRVSIGHELLINPSCLMLDEPTSGLDSTTATHLLDTLRRLASGGRSIITTIHQPSSRMYLQLDKLLLLAEGHALYYGSAGAVVSWFSHLGFKMPYGMNIADFILDLAMGEVSGSELSGRPAVQALYSTYEHYALEHKSGFKNQQDLHDVQLYVDTSTSATAALDVQTWGSSQGHAPSLGAAASLLSRTLSRKGMSDWARRASGADRPGARYMEQIKVLLVRCLKVRRFESLSTQKFLQLILVALITGLFWFQRGKPDTLAAASDTIGLLFFESLFPTFSAMFAALFTFPNDFRMLLKERASGMYQVSAFYIARTLSDLPMDCLYPSLFVIIVYFMGGLKLTAAAFFSNWLNVLLVLLVGQSLGLLLGALFMNPKSAQTVATVIMLSFMLVGGFFVRAIPPWISWIRYISFIYWGFNVALKVQFGGETLVACTTAVDGVQTCTDVTNITTALQLPTDVNTSVGLDVCVLLAMLVVLRLWVYVVLRHKTAAM